MLRARIIRRALLFCVMGCGLRGQTQVDLRTQSRGVDFQSAPYTKPVKAGAALPANCTGNELFLLTSAPAGANLYACVSANTWALESGNPLLGGDISGPSGEATVQKLQGRAVSPAAPQIGQALMWDGNDWSGQTLGSGGTITVEAAGSMVGSRGVQNYVAGAGVVSALTDAGNAIQIQHSADTSIVLTHEGHQAGQDVICRSSSGSGSNYTCTMLPILSAYESGMVVQWIPDADAAGGLTTLNIDILGATPIKMADGISDPLAGDVQAGRQYAIWFDGAKFRMPGAAPPLSGTAGTGPSCDAAHRGRVWHGMGGPGVKDELAVCVKTAGDAYVWQVLY